MMQFEFDKCCGRCGTFSRVVYAGLGQYLCLPHREEAIADFYAGREG